MRGEITRNIDSLMHILYRSVRTLIYSMELTQLSLDPEILVYTGKEIQGERFHRGYRRLEANDEVVLTDTIGLVLDKVMQGVYTGTVKVLRVGRNTGGTFLIPASQLKRQTSLESSLRSCRKAIYIDDETFETVSTTMDGALESGTQVQIIYSDTKNGMIKVSTMATINSRAIPGDIFEPDERHMDRVKETLPGPGTDFIITRFFIREEEVLISAPKTLLSPMKPCRVLKKHMFEARAKDGDIFHVSNSHFIRGLTYEPFSLDFSREVLIYNGPTIPAQRKFTAKKGDEVNIRCVEDGVATITIVDCNKEHWANETLMNMEHLVPVTWLIPLVKHRRDTAIRVRPRHSARFI